MVNRSTRIFVQILLSTERNGLLLSKIPPLIVQTGPYNRSIFGLIRLKKDGLHGPGHGQDHHVRLSRSSPRSTRLFTTPTVCRSHMQNIYGNHLHLDRVAHAKYSRQIGRYGSGMGILRLDYSVSKKNHSAFYSFFFIFKTFGVIFTLLEEVSVR